MGMEFGGTTSTGPPPTGLEFVEAISDVKQATVTATNGLAIEGSWCFTLKLRRGPRGAVAIKKGRKAYVESVETRRYKIGFKINQGQTIDDFSFRQSSGWFSMVEDVPTTNELTNTFATTPNDKWVGFIPPSGARRRLTWHEGLTACYRYRFSLSPLAATPPQAVVCLVTYGDLTFDAHHLKSVLLLSDREKSVRTSTRALVP